MVTVVMCSLFGVSVHVNRMVVIVLPTDQDYTPSSVLSGDLSLNAMAQECFTFFAILDSLDEINEAFTVSLSSTDSRADIVVEDDMVVITIVEAVTPTEGDVEGNTIHLTLQQYLMS